MRWSVSIPQQDPDRFDDAGLEEYLAQTVPLNPLGGGLDGDREQVERLVADVLPRVEES